MNDEQDVYELHRLRDEYLSAANLLEGGCDGAMCSRFRIPLDSEEFRGWLLAQIGFQGKIDFLRRVARAMGMSEEFRPLFGHLELVKGRRDEIAHSFVDLNPGIGFEDDPPGTWYQKRMHKTGRKTTRLQIGQLREQFEHALLVSLHFNALMHSIMLAATGQDSRSGLFAWQTAHRDVPPLDWPIP